MDKQVFIISQGRDGSTLLLKLLNAIDGYNICGENFGFMNSIGDIFRNLHRIDGMITRQEYDAKLSNPLYKPSWYNNFSCDEVYNYIVGFCQMMFNKESKFRVWGCKEIRFATNFEDNPPTICPYDEFEQRLNTIHTIFPNAKFIFTYREDINKQSLSAWWASNPNNSRHILTQNKEYFEKYMSKHSNSYILSYEDIIKCNNRFKNLYPFLGEHFDQNTFNKIIKVNSG